MSKTIDPVTSMAGLKQNHKRRLLAWFDNQVMTQCVLSPIQQERVDFVRLVPLISLHLMCLMVFVVGASQTAVLVAILSYLLRMFAITAFYHRYFSHRAFKTNRFWQFIFALLGASASQRGPLWWASNHRQHHRYSDTEKDIHSPNKSFWWSHLGWFLSAKHFVTCSEVIKDFNKFPELRWLDRFDVLVPVLYALLIWVLGEWLAIHYPSLRTNGWQLLVWGYFISSVVLLHATLMINSIAHRCGKRRFKTRDDSRNNFWLALMTLGEGWHNNHHHCPGSVKQGFFWWEIDVSYYVLKLMQWIGVIWDLKTVSPVRIRQSRLDIG